MRAVKNEKGYALLTVLLLTVIVVSLAAVFVAGSLNHASQEQAVDTNNHAVSAAEMGVLYYKSDFQLALETIEKEIAAQTQLKLNELIRCIEPETGLTCNTEEKRQIREQEIDAFIRSDYLNRIGTEIDELKGVASELPAAGTQRYPFGEEEDFSYWITSVESPNFSLTDPSLSEIQVELEVAGKARGQQRTLSTTFLIDVPDTFLNQAESIKVDTVTITRDKDVTYEEVFKLDMPETTCSSLLDQVEAGTAAAPYRCIGDADGSLENFVSRIVAAGFDPKEFTVYTADFADYVCSTNCNNVNFFHVNVVVSANDAGALNNMQNIKNATLLINGRLTAGNNLINLGKNGVKQTIIVKELDIDVNLKNMYYTNFLVLGNPVGSDARLSVGQHIEIDNYSRLCIDIDRISSTDLEALSRKIEFSDSGSLVYFSADPNKSFVLKDRHGNVQDDTALYVTRTNTYTSFLENCGVTLNNTVTEPTDVAVPNIIDSKFDFNVNY